MLLVTIVCRYCHIAFNICRCCFRRQTYCSRHCRLTARRISHRKAQRLYRQTEKGKLAHRLAENRRRHSQKLPGTKNMDDPSSTEVLSRYKVTSKDISDGLNACHFCGKIGVIVKAFPRRGYGRRNNEALLKSG